MTPRHRTAFGIGLVAGGLFIAGLTLPIWLILGVAVFAAVALFTAVLVGAGR